MAASRILADCGSMGVVACRDKGSKGQDLTLEGLEACKDLGGSTFQGEVGALVRVHTFLDAASARRRMALECAWRKDASSVAVALQADNSNQVPPEDARVAQSEASRVAASLTSDASFEGESF